VAAQVEDIAFHLETSFYVLQKALLIPFWTCGRKSSTLFLSWHNPAYGLSARGN